MAEKTGAKEDMSALMSERSDDTRPNTRSIRNTRRIRMPCIYTQQFRRLSDMHTHTHTHINVILYILHLDKVQFQRPEAKEGDKDCQAFSKLSAGVNSHSGCHKTS